MPEPCAGCWVLCCQLTITTAALAEHASCCCAYSADTAAHVCCCRHVAAVAAAMQEALGADDALLQVLKLPPFLMASLNAYLSVAFTTWKVELQLATQQTAHLQTPATTKVMRLT